MNDHHELRRARASKSRTRSRVRASLALLVVFGGLSLTAGRTPEGAADVDEARALLEEWVDARKIISKERQDWALGKELLTDRIDIVQSEIESLREKIAKAESSIAEADTKREELLSESESLSLASRAMKERVVEFERRTLELLVRLPEPLRETVLPLSQQVPTEPDKTDLSLSQRFQNVVGILNLVNKFNGKISTASEVRTLADGTTAEVTALYVGISQGFFVNGTATAASVGRSTATGWEWTPADQHADQIARAIAIHSNSEGAAFVQLPVDLE